MLKSGSSPETTCGACEAPKLCASALIWGLRGAFVFVDQPTEDGSASDSFGAQVGHRVVGAWWLQLPTAMWPSAVVVRNVLG